jgi:hypothetical protein
VSDSAVLRSAGRELSAVERERGDSGWTPELASRALASLRILGSYATGRSVSQTRGTAEGNGSTPEGCLAVRSGILGRRQVYVSGAVTSERITQALKTPRGARGQNGHDAGSLDMLAAALGAFSLAWYRPNGTLDNSALDEALATGRDLQRRIARRNSWPMKRMAALKGAMAAQGAKVWAR